MILLLSLMAAQSVPLGGNVNSPVHEVNVRCTGATYPQECNRAYVVAKESEELLKFCVRGIDKQRFDQTRRRAPYLIDEKELKKQCGDIHSACFLNWRVFFDRYRLRGSEAISRLKPEYAEEQIQNHCALPRESY